MKVRLCCLITLSNDVRQGKMVFELCDFLMSEVKR